MTESFDGISVVVPVFRSTSTLSQLVERVNAAIGDTYDYEIILVDDGSPESTWSVIEGLVSAETRVRGIRLSRNFGQHSALVAGVRAAKYDLIATIDDDLQNPPEEILTLVEVLQSQNLDVVYGVPRDTRQSVPRRLAGRLTRSALKNALGAKDAPSFSSFRVFRTRLRTAFDADLGTGVSLDALLTWGSSRFGAVPVRHDERAEGESNYSFRHLLRFAIDVTTGYSVVPLKLASVLGLSMALFGLLILAVVVIVPLIVGGSVPGFPFIASTIAIFSGAQLFTLGVIGEYLARMHFRIMGKPTYVVLDEIGRS